MATILCGKVYTLHEHLIKNSMIKSYTHVVHCTCTCTCVHNVYNIRSP